MNKLLGNFKKNYFLLINSIVPLLIFLIPIIATNYIDEIEQIVYYYNFYSFFNFSYDLFFSILCLVIVVCCVINFIIFILKMVDSYKLLLYKNFLNKLLLVCSFLITICSLILLIYIIILSTDSFMSDFIYYNSFCLGSVILFIYSITQNIIVLIKYKRKSL